MLVAPHSITHSLLYVCLDMILIEYNFSLIALMGTHLWKCFKGPRTMNVLHQCHRRHLLPRNNTPGTTVDRLCSGKFVMTNNNENIDEEKKEQYARRERQTQRERRCYFFSFSLSIAFCHRISSLFMLDIDIRLNIFRISFIHPRAHLQRYIQPNHTIGFTAHLRLQIG